MLEIETAFPKSNHALHFKLLVFYKFINRDGLQLAKRSKFQKLSFITFRIADVLQNYQSRWPIVGETLRVLILQFRLQISNFKKSVKEHCLR